LEETPFLERTPLKRRKEKWWGKKKENSRSNLNLSRLRTRKKHQGRKYYKKKKRGGKLLTKVEKKILGPSSFWYEQKRNWSGGGEGKIEEREKGKHKKTGDIQYFG